MFILSHAVVSLLCLRALFTVQAMQEGTHQISHRMLCAEGPLDWLCRSASPSVVPSESTWVIEAVNCEGQAHGGRSLPLCCRGL